MCDIKILQSLKLSNSQSSVKLANRRTGMLKEAWSWNLWYSIILIVEDSWTSLICKSKQLEITNLYSIIRTTYSSSSCTNKWVNRILHFHLWRYLKIDSIIYFDFHIFMVHWSLICKITSYFTKSLVNVFYKWLFSHFRWNASLFP